MPDAHQALAVSREARRIELDGAVDALLARRGRAAPYDPDFER